MPGILGRWILRIFLHRRQKKDLIIASGYNIHPRDIDEILFEHLKTSRACTIGIPHDYRGKTVKAFIVLKEG